MFWAGRDGGIPGATLWDAEDRDVTRRFLRALGHKTEDLEDCRPGCCGRASGRCCEGGLRKKAMVDTGVAEYVEKQIAAGRWREEVLAPEVTGLARPVTVLRGRRKGNFIMHSQHGDETTLCPDHWSDLACGSGCCSIQCRACFLILTHRAFKDPHRHLLYDNVAELCAAARAWLLAPQRRRAEVLGIGIDRSDSLLYEGLVPYVRELAPVFGDPAQNPHGCRMVLLTKTANSRYLAEVAPEHRPYIIATFSLNPQRIADLWEGQWPDGGRIPPPIATRIVAARYAQDLGYEVRLRVDPILWPEGWAGWYAEFVAQVAAAGLQPTLWTLGSYREKNAQLDLWREKWGLPPLGWEPPRAEFIQDGTHQRIPPEQRVALYRTVGAAIRQQFPQARLGLCKETKAVWDELGWRPRLCNCMGIRLE